MSHLLPGERLDIDPAVLEPGDRVFYLQPNRGGYGFDSRVPAVVAGFTAHRVTIRVVTREGLAERTISVLATNLRRREER